MRTIRISVASFTFVARLERDDAPETSRKFESLLPFRSKLVHARWSGEACWIPLADFSLGVGPENLTSRPAPGNILWYAGSESETEVLVPYGETRFAAKCGELAGNHFLTVVEGVADLPKLGRLVLWSGAQDVVFERSLVGTK